MRTSSIPPSGLPVPSILPTSKSLAFNAVPVVTTTCCQEPALTVDDTPALTYIVGLVKPWAVTVPELIQTYSVPLRSTGYSVVVVGFTQKATVFTVLGPVPISTKSSVPSKSRAAPLPALPDTHVGPPVSVPSFPWSVESAAVVPVPSSKFQ